MLSAGIPAVVLDDFSSGRREFVPADVPVVEASLLDGCAVERALRQYAVEGAVHLAAFKHVGLSVREPLTFYENNVEGTRNLLEKMVDVGVGRLVFSSSCSVYGSPDTERVTEETPTAPVSPYGTTKLLCEWLIRDVARVHDLRFTSLRYFNVVGSGAEDVRDESPFALFPAVMRDLMSGRTPCVNGDDYPTRDGTCERDFIHVSDVADAHLRAAQKLMLDIPLEPVYNLGTGQGATVLEMLDLIQRTSGQSFERRVLPRRPGDAARIVASADLAVRSLGWRPRRSHAEMVASAWRAWSR
jgi:UDP-glucose 4-epimerase